MAGFFKSSFLSGVRGRQPNYIILLSTLLFLATLAPIWRDSFSGRIVYQGLATLLFLVSLRVHRKRRNLFKIAVGLGGLGLLIAWLDVFRMGVEVRVGAQLLNAAFYLILGAMILVDVIVVRKAGIQSVAGTLCAYLLIGITFAYIYAALDDLQPGNFNVSTAYFEEFEEPRLNGFSQYLYFSFVTMSTLGFGDIHPVSPMAQTLTWIQSVTGQFYLAVLVAWLVGSLPQHGDEPPE